MNRRHKAALLAALLSTQCLWGLQSAGASVVYTYKGNVFTDITPYSCILGTGSGAPCPTGVANYDGDRITASITLSMPLGKNFSGAVSPVSYTISDGVATLTPPNPVPPGDFSFGSGPAFVFQTNSAGKIIGWDITVGCAGLATTTCYFMRTTNTVDAITDLGDTNLAVPSGFIGGIHQPSGLTHDPGVWSTTPIPASGILMATGLAGLGLFGWRRKRKAQTIDA